MSTIRIAFTREAENVVRLMRDMPQRILPAIARGLDGALEVGLGLALKYRFTGRGPFQPSEQKLGVVTGRLRGSFQRSPARISGATVTAGVGSNVRYWAAHEFGFSGTVRVRDHTRRVKGRDVYRKVTKISRKTARHSSGRERIASGFTRVETHIRELNIPARRPMQAGLNDALTEMSGIVSKSVLDTWGGKA